MNNIFLGTNGLRAGWRLLIFLALVSALFAGLILALHLLLPPGDFTPPGFAHGVASPVEIGSFESILFLFVSIAAFIMAKIEHRRFSEYGLPWRSAFRANFWQGAICGFLAISAVLFTIFVLQGFRITGLASRRAAVLPGLAAWTLVFIIVGLSEEFTYRGYAQFTLSTGIGFWPSALLISSTFVLFHVLNAGESAFGLIHVFEFGLVSCWILRSTGDLWWSVGFHAAWDWGQSFFYGVPDSGLRASHNLFSSEFHGPNWLTGGNAGPEGSIFSLIALVIVGFLVSRRVPLPIPFSKGGGKI